MGWADAPEVAPKSAWEAAPVVDAKPGVVDNILQGAKTVASGVGNAVAGLVRGAGSLGATILAPYDIAKDAIAGKGLSLDSNRERRAGMDDALKTVGAEPKSAAYQGGKIAGEIAGTAGAGGVIANGLRLVPGLANAAPKVISAVESGGLKLGGPSAVTTAEKVGDAALRAGGGAVTGGATAGLVNPDDAGAGAAVGAALPGAVKVAAIAGGKLAQVAARSAAKGGENATRDATLKASQDAGYVVPPSTTNPGLLNQTLESVGGKAAVGQQASIQNQKVTNALARKELGLPENAPLSDKVLDAYRDAVSAPYREVAALPAMPPQRTTGIGGYPLIGPQQQAPADALHDLQQARFDANDYWNEYRRTGEVAARDKATALGTKVSGLEDYLEQTAIAAGKPDLVNALRDARQKIAKSYTVERALNIDTGDVSARDLAKMLNKGQPLGEHLETAARFANAFPKANQDVAPIGSQNVSKVAASLAGIMGGGGLAAGGPVGGIIGATLPFVAPTAAQKLLLSRGYQGAMATPSYGATTGRLAGGLKALAPAAASPALRALVYDEANPRPASP